MPARPPLSQPARTLRAAPIPSERYLYIYVNPALDKGDVAAYLNWIRSDDGQKYVQDVGYYPLPPNPAGKVTGDFLNLGGEQG